MCSESVMMFDILKPIPEKGSDPKEQAGEEPIPHDKRALKRLLSKVVSFKDLHLTVHHDSSTGSLTGLPDVNKTPLASASSVNAAELTRALEHQGSQRVIIEQKKLAIILVGELRCAISSRLINTNSCDNLYGVWDPWVLQGYVKPTCWCLLLLPLQGCLAAARLSSATK